MTPIYSANITFEDMKETSRSVANSRFLRLWRDHSVDFSHTQYSAFCQNMILRLTPTAQRLSLGLELLLQERKKFSFIIDAFGHNIEDETGDGDPDMAHAALFTQSCSTYTDVIYGKKLLKVEPAETSIKFHEESISLFNDNVYVMLGACMAQETHALPQLEYMFLGHEKAESKFNRDDWDKVKYFYDLHFDGTEARHAEDLNKTVWEVLGSSDSKNLFFSGYNRFIQLQAQFWKGVEQEIFPDFAYSTKNERQDLSLSEMAN